MGVTFRLLRAVMAGVGLESPRYSPSLGIGFNHPPKIRDRSRDTSAKLKKCDGHRTFGSPRPQSARSRDHLREEKKSD